MGKSTSRSWPALYKKTATGAIQVWEIAVRGQEITTSFGQVGGKIQTTFDVVKQGKNIGRKNGTTPEEQAELEAAASWEKKKKAGYIEKLDDAKSGQVDKKVILGGVLPMLAKKYEDHASKVQYPIYAQPKLDGIRCICTFDKRGKASLWSRTRKRLTALVHLESQLENLCAEKGLHEWVLDGEIYSDEFKDNFEEIVSIARTQKGIHEDAKKLQYHIYDCIPRDKSIGFGGRVKLLARLEPACANTHLKIVETQIVTSEERMRKKLEHYLDQGYEGLMVRQDGKEYEHKRSSQLLKVKKFMDEEFIIVGVEEGRGKLTGHAGAFICLVDQALGDFEENRFRAKCSGATEKLREYWENKKAYSGQWLTVKFQDYTTDGKPRFPVGMRIRGDKNL